MLNVIFAVCMVCCSVCRICLRLCSVTGDDPSRCRRSASFGVPPQTPRRSRSRWRGQSGTISSAAHVRLSPLSFFNDHILQDTSQHVHHDAEMATTNRDRTKPSLETPALLSYTRRNRKNIPLDRIVYATNITKCAPLRSVHSFSTTYVITHTPILHVHSSETVRSSISMQTETSSCPSPLLTLRV